MALTYQTFLKKGINLAPLGWETEGAFILISVPPEEPRFLAGPVWMASTTAPSAVLGR